MTGRAGVAGPLLALVAVALVAGCGGTASVVASPPGTTPAPAASLAIVSVYNLLPGQCFDAVFDKDDDRVLAAIVRSCDEPHGAEVFGTPELSDPAGTPYAEDAVTQAAQEACVPAFRDYVGVEYDASRLEATYYGPYEWTWAAGDRAIICFVQGTPEDPLTKSVEGLRESAMPSASLSLSSTPGLAIVDPFDLAAGQCFDEAIDKVDGSVLAAIVRSCDEPHWAEVFGTTELSDPVGAPYAEDAVTQAAQEAFATAFRDYVGVEYDASRLEGDFYRPSEETWAAGGRAIICFVKGTPEDPLTKSVKGLRE